MKKRPRSSGKRPAAISKRPAASSKEPLCDTCGCIPRPGHTIHTGSESSLYCSGCYKTWKDDGGNPLAMEVVLKPPRSYADMASKTIFVVPNMFPDLYRRIVKELAKKSSWSTRHGLSKCHSVHDNPLVSATVKDVSSQLARSFFMSVESVRLNWYEASDHKPLHQDKHIFKKASKSNVWTAAVSFGGTRALSLAHPSFGNTVGFKLSSGDAYAFGPNINADYLHGIPKVDNQDIAERRLSIVVWGSVKT